MTTIAIQNLQKVDLITELENYELNTTKGGAFDPVTLGVVATAAAATAFWAGYDNGIRLYDNTQND